MGKPKYCRGDKVRIVGYEADVEVVSNGFLKNDVWYYQLNIGMNCAEDLLTRPEVTTARQAKAG